MVYESKASQDQQLVEVKKTKKEEKKTLTGAACADKQMKGMQRFHSVTLSPSTIAQGPSQSLDQRQTEEGGGKGKQTHSH